MTQYMLDTNTVSNLIRKYPVLAGRLVAVPMASLCISAITEGELLFGLAKRPAARRLHVVVREFLRLVDALPWDHDVAERYGALRAELELKGKTLSPLDLQIAAHALCLDAVLVTNDRVFRQVVGLQLEDWTK